MIGLGAQYLTAAGFGRYRITAASLGSAKVIWPEWLTAATRQAIMAAFGADGPAVIAATNEYLNGIAASDKAKATALAGFINEDPMMVCSLGLEPQGVTMPVRWLVGDGGQWIHTPWKPDFGITYGATILPQFDTNENKSIFGVRDSGNSPTFLLQAHQRKLRTETFSSWTGYGSLLQNVACSTEFSYKGLWEDGVQLVSGNYNPSRAFSINIYIYAHNVNGSAGADGYSFPGGFAEFYRKDANGNKTNNLLPFKLGVARTAEQVYPQSSGAQAVGTNGMLDIETGIFYPNQGVRSFTIPDISYTP